MLEKLFTDWDLDTWANVLEVAGFIMATCAFIIGLFIKNEIVRLKTSYIFKARINEHIKQLSQSASDINNLLNDYDNNKSIIRTELSKCQSELEDLIPKLGYFQGQKSRNLVRFIESRKNKPFVNRDITMTPLKYFFSKYPNRIIKTTYDDTWIVYNKLMEVVRQIENIKKNRAKSV